MGKKKEYGGYLPLELPFQQGEYFSEIQEDSIVRINCGRNAFWYALSIIKPSKLYVPYFNCINSTDPADLLGIPYEFYRLDEELLPLNVTPSAQEAIIWVNYYGNATQNQIDRVVEKYSNTNLIIDNCHAFFSQPILNVYNCYSARKFFGVCDGAYLIKNNIELIELPTSESAAYASFLLETIEQGTNALYSKNLENEKRLGSKVCQMSPLTKHILSSIDYENVKSIRKRNFNILHNQLGKYNKFNVNTEVDTHVCYPLLIKDELLREKLIERKLYIPTWWRHVPDYFSEETLETKLAKYMLLLPIDQRYDENDMEDIVQIVLEEYGG